ncbi:MAG: hypothetical protein AB7D35_10065 [Bacteroidales bacterium]|jgi:hypothetical protein
MELGRIYLVTFDFYRNRSKFKTDDEFNYEYAVEYFENCLWVKDTLFRLFPNSVIEISLCSFLIKTRLDSEELKSKLIRETSDSYSKGSDTINRNIFIAKVNNLQSFAYQKKISEIDYIFSKQV